MKTRRATCLMAFLFFGWLTIRTFLKLSPYWGPDSYFQSPEGIIFVLPLVIIFGAIALSGLYGAWRSHQALRGDFGPARGPRAFLDALVWIIFGFGLLGLSLACVVAAVGYGLPASWWKMALVYSGATTLEVAGLAAFVAAFRAVGRRKLTLYRTDLE